MVGDEELRGRAGAADAEAVAREGLHERAPRLVRRHPSTRSGSRPAGAHAAPRRRPRRPWRAAGWSAAGLLVATAIGAGVAVADSIGRGPAAAPIPPSPRPPLQPSSVDVDGDGTADDVTVDGAVIVVGSGRRAGRYSLGQPGGTVLVVDLDCDGVATPVVHRRAEGRVYVFARWPEHEPVAPQVRTVPIGADLRVHSRRGCHELEVAGRRIR